MSDGGKGSKPRPIPDPKQFEENWDRIFKKVDKSEYMCPNCLTPWKCNGPHIEEKNDNRN